MTDVLARVARAEARQCQVALLERMSERQLRELLGGDPAKAAPWVRSAAECGLPAAQLRWGRMLLEGEGVARNRELAALWFTRAAHQGDAEAMNMAGRCHENGWGVGVQLEAAARWYESSARLGHDWGQYNLGNLLFDGRGIATDPPRALAWYRRAAAQGHSRAMNLLGRCAEEGWGCPKNSAEAFEWYRLSAEYGYFRGQYNYAAALAERGRTREATDWLWKAALSGTETMRHAILDALADARDPLLRGVCTRVRELVGA